MAIESNHALFGQCWSNLRAMRIIIHCIRVSTVFAAAQANDQVAGAVRVFHNGESRVEVGRGLGHIFQDGHPGLAAQLCVFGGGSHRGQDRELGQRGTQERGVEEQRHLSLSRMPILQMAKYKANLSRSTCIAHSLSPVACQPCLAQKNRPERTRQSQKCRWRWPNNP